MPSHLADATKSRLSGVLIAGQFFMSPWGSERRRLHKYHRTILGEMSRSEGRENTHGCSRDGINYTWRLLEGQKRHAKRARAREDDCPYFRCDGSRSLQKGGHERRGRTPSPTIPEPKIGAKLRLDGRLSSGDTQYNTTCNELGSGSEKKLFAGTRPLRLAYEIKIACCRTGENRQ